MLSITNFNYFWIKKKYFFEREYENLAFESFENYSDGWHEQFLSEEIKIEEVFWIQKEKKEHDNIWFNLMI